MKQSTVIETGEELVNCARSDRCATDKTPQLPQGAKLRFEVDQGHIPHVSLAADGFRLDDTLGFTQIIVALAKHAGLKVDITS